MFTTRQVKVQTEYVREGRGEYKTCELDLFLGAVYINFYGRISWPNL